MDDILLDLAEDFKETNKIREIIKSNSKDIDTLKADIDSFLKNTIKGVSLEFFMIKLIQMCYYVDFHYLNRKTNYELLYLISASADKIRKQLSLLRQMPQWSYEFDEILRIKDEDLERILDLFTVFGNVLQKSQIIPVSTLNEELQSWHTRNLQEDFQRFNEEEKKKRTRSLILFVLLACGIAFVLIILLHLLW